MHQMHTFTTISLVLLSAVAAANANTCAVEVVSGSGWKENSQSVNWYEMNITSDSPTRIPWNISIESNAIATNSPYTVENNIVSRTLNEYWNAIGRGLESAANVVIASVENSSQILHVFEDDVECDVTFVNTSTTNAQVENSLSFVTSSAGQLLGVDGQALFMKGVNWFGFEYSGHSMVDGLSFGSSSISQDFATVVYRQQLLGFNTVRLPFSFQNLFGGAYPDAWTQPCSIDTKDTVVKATSDPSVSTVSSDAPLPKSPAPVLSGVCNNYLPSDTILNRYLYVVRYYAQNGFYVLIDNHLNVDPTAVNNPTLWVQYWRQLAQMIASDPLTAPYVVMEILNEPDSYGFRWESGNGKTAYGDLLLQAMDAIQSVAPGQAMMIEGTGQLGLGVNWGNGFATNSPLISSTGISDPNAFFTQLLTRSYVNQVIIAPHIYPASITGSTGQSGQALYSTLTEAVGYLNDVGYCSGTTCHKFPIVMTETGSMLTDPRDLSFFNDLIPYIQNTGQGVDGGHNAFAGSVWWAWNNNALDTGGLVGSDWTTILWQKVQLLQTLMTLRPWYTSSSGAATESAPMFDLTPVQTQLLAAPLRGIEFVISTLLETNDKLFGDLLTVTQRWKLLGFNTIYLPFSFEDLTNTTYFTDLVRDCAAANDTRIKTSVQPSDLPPGLLNGYRVPNVANVTDASSTVCNSYIQPGTTRDVFVQILELLSESGVDVLLINTDIQMALSEPINWLTQWVDLAVTLPNGTLLCPLDTASDDTTWDSGQKSPGLSDLYATLLPALSGVSPDSPIFLMGVDGNDFSSAANFLRSVSSSSTLSNITVALAGDSSSLSSENNTVGCTEAYCGTFPLTFVLNASSPSVLQQNVSLMNSTWFAQLSDPLRPKFDELLNLQAAGLKPWYGASTAYNPSYTLGSANVVLGVEAGNYDDFPCYANVSTYFASSQPPFTAVLDINITNAMYTSLVPPYSTTVNLTDALAIQTVFGHPFDYLNGILTVSFQQYHDILFPDTLNSQKMTAIVDSASGSTDVSSLFLNGMACEITTS